MKKKLTVSLHKGSLADKIIKHDVKKLSVKDRLNIRLLKGTLTGSALGGIMVALFGFFYPSIGPEFANNPSADALAKTALGFVVSGGIGGLIRFPTTQANYLASVQNTADVEHKPTLQLREEQLDISKRWVETGNVSMHKEVLTEDKSIVVPVTREELVIKKKVLNENTDLRPFFLKFLADHLAYTFGTTGHNSYFVFKHVLLLK